MPKTCPCPKCERQVAVPIDVSPHAHVRCPRCGEEYRLSDVLDFVPPLLVLVDAELSPPAERAEGDSGLGGPTSVLNLEPVLPVAAAGLLAESEAPTAGQAPSAENGRQGDFFEDFLGGPEQPQKTMAEETVPREITPDDSGAAEEFNLMSDAPEDAARAGSDDDRAPAAAEISFEPLDADDLPPAAGGELADDSDELEELDFDEESEVSADDTAVSELDFSDTGETAAADDDDDEIELDLESMTPPPTAGREMGMAGAASAASATPILPPARRRTPEKGKSSWTGSLIGFTISGLIGLSAAYMALIWIEPSADALHLGARLPAWMVPADLRAQQPGSGVAIVDAPGSSFRPQTENEKRMTAPDSVFNEKASADKTGTAPAPTTPAATPSSTPPGEVPPPPGSTPPTADAGKAPAATTDAKPREADPFAEPATASTAETAPSLEDELQPEATPPAGTAPAVAASNPAPGATPTAPGSPEARTPGAGSVANTVNRPTTVAPTTPATVATPAAAAGPQGAPKFGSADLRKSLADYQTASAAYAGASGVAAKKAKQAHYKSLYNLAGTLTYTQAGQADQNAARLRDEVQQAVTTMAADPTRRADMGKVASVWMGLPPARRGAHQGVVLVGTVEQVAKQGPLEEIHLHLAGRPSKLVVLSGTHVDLRPQQPVAVLGSIVAEPSKAIQGYQGAEQNVVWSGAVLPLEK